MSRSSRRKKRKFKRKHNSKTPRGMNLHHLKNKMYGGANSVQNLLRIYVYKHREWHAMFKNMDLDQAIVFLKRVKRAKENQVHSNIGGRADFNKNQGGDNESMDKDML